MEALSPQRLRTDPMQKLKHVSHGTATRLRLTAPIAASHVPDHARSDQQITPVASGRCCVPCRLDVVFRHTTADREFTRAVLSRAAPRGAEQRYRRCPRPGSAAVLSGVPARDGW